MCLAVRGEHLGQAHAERREKQRLGKFLAKLV